jgi:hypothetical protein
VPQNYNGGCDYANGIFVAAEGLDFFRLGVIATGGSLSHQATCLCEKDFGWMALWELNPEVVGSLWLMASATWGGGGKSLRLKATMIGEGRPCPF